MVENNWMTPEEMRIVVVPKPGQVPHSPGAMPTRCFECETRILLSLETAKQITDRFDDNFILACDTCAIKIADEAMDDDYKDVQGGMI